MSVIAQNNSVADSEKRSERDLKHNSAGRFSIEFSFEEMFVESVTKNVFLLPTCI